jgi:hypothetical protein
MKTLKDLFELVAVAVERNNTHSEDWFIDYSGHVNKLSIRHYFCGWSKDAHVDQANFTLDSDGIQGAYWFIKTRM